MSNVELTGSPNGRSKRRQKQPGSSVPSVDPARFDVIKLRARRIRMHIEIPKDAEALARGQAEAAGFASVDECVTNLIRDRSGAVSLSREDALDDLKKLRSETPKMTSEEIVDLVTQARADL